LVGTTTMALFNTASVIVVSCSLMAMSRAAARMLCTIFARIPL
jgi:rhodanese-related sulfurtransferase